MSKLVTFLLGLSLASMAGADPGDSNPPGTDPGTDDLTRGIVCPDGTIVAYEEDCPLMDRQEKPVLTTPTKPHIGWDDPR
jgi:hypothetical protein